MGNYTELFYHFVWATKLRAPYITPQVERSLHDFLRHKCRQQGTKIYAVNGMPDHVHVVCSLPTSLCIAEFMEKIKGSSSYAINQEARQKNDLQTCLYWQPGFGALTLDVTTYPRVVRYVDNQKRHHAADRISDKLECCHDAYSLSSAPKGVRSE